MFRRSYVLKGLSKSCKTNYEQMNAQFEKKLTIKFILLEDLVRPVDKY